MVQHGALQQLQRFEFNIQPRPWTPEPSDVWSDLAAQLEAPRTTTAAPILDADTHDTAQVVDRIDRPLRHRERRQHHVIFHAEDYSSLH
ncbi:MAG: hypothetical protein Q4D79_13340 [Propionibacteriaceae bacterium]|nr:hypothetical protein [Propionibacteriaceae bacterium]